MAAHVTEHPADLIREAEELEQRAEEQMVLVRQCRAEAAKLRARADRINSDSGVNLVVRRGEPDDPLLAAAALAVEDIPGTFTSTELAKALAISNATRALRLLVRLRDMGHVEQQPDGRFRSVDPEAGRIRDAVIELHEFTRAELAEHVGLVPEALTWYLTDLRARGIIVGADDDEMAYNPPGRETVVTRRRRAPAPEAELIDQAPERGQVIEFTGKPMIESGGNQRHAGRRKARGGNVRKQKKRGR
jgi:hypothetical protein